MISLDKIPAIAGEFIDTRLIPNAPSSVKWLLGGASFIVASRYTEAIPMMKALGLVTASNMIDLEMVKGALKAAFEKQPTVEYYGFKFDKADGDALISIMEKHNG